MKKETILDLYYGKLNPMDMKLGDEEEYRACSFASLQGAEEFSSKLTPELKREFEQLWAKEQEADELLHRDAFCKGFRTGLRLAAEAFMD